MTRPAESNKLIAGKLIAGKLMTDEDFYWEGEFLVFTAQYHLKRGECCGSKCRHCPYDPRWTKGTVTTAQDPARQMNEPESQSPDDLDLGFDTAF